MSSTYKYSRDNIVDNIHVFIVPDYEVASLSEHRAFVENAEIMTFCLDDSEIFNILNSSLKKEGILDQLVVNPPVKIELGVVAGRFDEKNANSLSIPANSRIYSTTFSSLNKLGHSINHGKTDWLPFSTSFEEGESHFSIRITFENSNISTHYDSRLDTNPLSSLRRFPAGQWIDPSSQQYNVKNVFPNMYAIFDEISSNTINDAKRFLEKKILVEQPHPKVYGVEIDRRFGSIVVPLVLLSLMAFMLTHILALKEQLMKCEHKQSFPFILLYDGRVAISLMISSIVILPLVSTLAFIFRFREAADYYISLGFMCMFGNFVIAIIIAKTSKEIRDWIRNMPNKTMPPTV